jgi:hypothetical protein
VARTTHLGVYPLDCPDARVQVEAVPTELLDPDDHPAVVATT